MNPLLRAALLCLVLLIVPGCTAGFDRDWKRTASPRQDSFAGRWTGTWRSEQHRGASGDLRCILIPRKADRYRASFQAGWLCFTSHYGATFQTERKGGEIRFRGAEDLGWLFGGVYTFEGRATRGRFQSRYRSGYDHGVFEMTRLPK